MRCESCGTELPPEARFCLSCGKLLGALTPLALAGSRVARHLHTLSILWIVWSVLHLVGAVALLILAHTLFAPFGLLRGSPEVPRFVQPILSAVGVVLLVSALAGIAAGWGLMDRQSWARVLAIVLGFLALPSFPLGTALGIYSLWVLLHSRGGEEYRQLERARQLGGP
jgi:zinc-ribbon domain